MQDFLDAKRKGALGAAFSVANARVAGTKSKSPTAGALNEPHAPDFRV
jgi:hypothetical protein